MIPIKLTIAGEAKNTIAINAVHFISAERVGEVTAVALRDWPTSIKRFIRAPKTVIQPLSYIIVTETPASIIGQIREAR
jgi:hypothetical protein